MLFKLQLYDRFSESHTLYVAPVHICTLINLYGLYVHLPIVSSSKQTQFEPSGGKYELPYNALGAQSECGAG
jgi:hypothetical protein